MKTGFYKAFEDRFRGSREVIKDRLRVYLPFSEPFKQTDAKLKIFDIGCGRGEWLELMTESGFDAYGIDIDEGMLADCHEKKLPAAKGDAVAFIKTLENDSHTIISAFHVAEHLSFDDLNVVVAEALRILKPGGLLIMETPNPENIMVATKYFYLDPTHNRPIPPELLSFLPEYHGFERAKVLRLHEPDNVINSDHQRLHNVITGVSPDYAVIAQKTASPEALAKFDHAFEKEHGMELEVLSNQYDQSILHNINIKTTEAQTLAREATSRATQAESRAVQAEHHATQAESRAVQAEHHATQAESRAVQAEHRAAQADISLQAVYASWSWRITWPLRKLLDVAKMICRLPVSLVRWVMRLPARFASWMVVKAMAFAIQRDPLRLRLLGQVNKYPRLKARLMKLGQEKGLIDQPLLSFEGTDRNAHTQDNEGTDFDLLSPRAKTIYHDFKKALEQGRKENT